MKVLIIGSGGREHAIAYTLNKSPKVSKIYAIPGNPGIAKIATCIDKSILDFDFILEFVKTNQIDLTVIGPEIPLCMGLTDILEEQGCKVFGPRKLASTLEGSKAFSKHFMEKYNIPTAKYFEVTSYNDGLNALSNFTYPVVIKADGLAAGKGVVICKTYEEAKKTLYQMLEEKLFESAGEKVVIEEFLTGYECSLLCFTDGKTIVPMVNAKDHKQIYDGNVGPNTGGMGTISPNPFFKEELNEQIEKEILNPFVEGLKKEQIDYRGVIFIGLMVNNNQAKVLEFNVRFGDPETQVILLRLDTDLFEIMNHVANQTLDQIQIKWKDEVSGCVVLASGGYPNSYEKGKEITLSQPLSNDIIIFHAGTKQIDDKIYTNGGRVLNVCCLGSNLTIVRKKIYQEIEKINFEGKYYRTDIGLR